MVRRIAFVAAISGLVLTAPVAVLAKPPGGKGKGAPATSSVSVAAAANPVPYAHPVAISGKLTSKTVAGVSVTLEAAPYPYAHFASVATAATDASGAYHFAPSPRVNTEYRVTAKSKPHAVSSTLLVQVRTRVSLRVTTTAPKAGTRVTFRGSVLPADDGQVVLIQRRSAGGAFVTVARATLHHTSAGTSSTYGKALRIKASGSYRVMKPHDADNAAGLSRIIRITAH